MKKENVIVISLSFVSMVLAGVILNTYYYLSDGIFIDSNRFNNILLKSIVTSLVIVIFIVMTNYKKLKS